MRKKNRIILTTSPWHTFFGEDLPYVPIGLTYIAAVLEQEGHDVTVISPDSIPPTAAGVSVGRFDSANWEENLFSDDFHVWTHLKEFFTANPFDVVGISVMISQFPSAFRVARIARSVNPNALIVFGGIGVTVKPELAFSEEGLVDYVVRGEGEHTFRDLMKVLEGGGNITEVMGVSFIKDGLIQHNSNAVVAADISSIPHPAKHLYRTIIKGQPIPPIAYGRLFLSRGCPFQCTYCDSNKLWSRKVRYSTAQYVVEQITRVRDEFGTRLFVFDDDNFFLHPKLCNQILDLMISANLGISWRCEVRANTVSLDLLKKMKRAGCCSITLGVESGNNDILKKIKKGITVEDTRKTARLIKEAGILLNAFFIFGFPWEDETHFQDTLAQFHELAPDGEVGGVCSFLIPYPGTQIFEEIKQMGLLPSLPLHHFHHHNDSIKITPHISTERYRQLTKEISREFDRTNTWKRIRLLLKNPRYFYLNLQQRNFFAFDKLAALAKSAITGVVK